MMYFLLLYMFVGVGVMMSGLGFLMPEMFYAMPKDISYGMLGMGMLLAMVGVVLVHFRAMKVGANHLIAPGSPNKILWFYVNKDDTLRIVPAFRDVEGLSYSKKLDTESQELKSYRLFDHSIRFVVEGLGHCVDLKACLYGYFLKTKYGFKNMNEARAKKISGEVKSKLTGEQLMFNREYKMDGDELDKRTST